MIIILLVLEGTPETLVQGVPSALSEVYARTVNGQMSDASMHEEDQSEPTVATLSSEATGEMDVSSLDDKSQTDTHVEKRGKLKDFLILIEMYEGNVEKNSIIFKVLLLKTNEVLGTEFMRYYVIDL